MGREEGQGRGTGTGRGLGGDVDARVYARSPPIRTEVGPASLPFPPTVPVPLPSLPPPLPCTSCNGFPATAGGPSCSGCRVTDRVRRAFVATDVV